MAYLGCATAYSTASLMSNTMLFVDRNLKLFALKGSQAMMRKDKGE